jgi:hypothetical protein
VRLLRLILQRGEPMADPLYFREKAKQALRLARDSTDPMLAKSLTDLAREYMAEADATDGTTLGKDPEGVGSLCYAPLTTAFLARRRMDFSTRLHWLRLLEIRYHRMPGI